MEVVGHALAELAEAQQHVRHSLHDKVARSSRSMTLCTVATVMAVLVYAVSQTVTTIHSYAHPETTLWLDADEGALDFPSLFVCTHPGDNDGSAAAVATAASDSASRRGIASPQPEVRMASATVTPVLSSARCRQGNISDPGLLTNLNGEGGGSGGGGPGTTSACSYTPLRNPLARGRFERYVCLAFNAAADTVTTAQSENWAMSASFDVTDASGPVFAFLTENHTVTQDDAAYVLEEARGVRPSFVVGDGGTVEYALLTATRSVPLSGDSVLSYSAETSGRRSSGGAGAEPTRVTLVLAFASTDVLMQVETVSEDWLEALGAIGGAAALARAVHLTAMACLRKRRDNAQKRRRGDGGGDGGGRGGHGGTDSGLPLLRGAGSCGDERELAHVAAGAQ